MKTPVIKRIIVTAIVLFALFFRIDRVGSVPPALSWDEVSIGYNAYSILKSGRDEHGHVMPYDTFVAYGDYKPPLAVYLTVPFIALFGLNEVSVRLPSVLAGTATVFLTYVFTLELFRWLGAYGSPTSGRKTALITGKPESGRIGFAAAIFSGLLVSISPWHIQLSRAGWEANIAVLFVLLSLYLYIRAVRNPELYAFAGIGFILAIYTFNSARYVAPMLWIMVVLFTSDSVRKHIKQALTGMVISALLLLPIMPHLISPEARLRFREVNIFTDSSVVSTANQRISDDGQTPVSKIIHNRRLGYVRSFILHYLDNLEPDFLFVKGDGNPKFSTQDTGQLYSVEFPLLIYGLFLIFRYFPKGAWFLSLWLILSIFPAATARETPHALRIENTIPVWQIFIGFALAVIWVRKYAFKKFILAVVLGSYILSLAYFWHNYVNHYPAEFSQEWQYGYKEAVNQINTLGKEFEKIIVSETKGRPYMFVLFYSGFDPDKFTESKKSYFDEYGFYHVTGFGKYEFVKTVEGGYQGNTLYVMPPDEVPANAIIYTTVRTLNGDPTLVIFRI